MSVKLIALSHSPLLGINEPKPEVNEALQDAFAKARKAAEEYDPDLVIVFTPDHFNGFFYTLMPPFCVGLQAESMGDYLTTPGPFDVPESAAEELAQFVIDQDVDMAISR